MKAGIEELINHILFNRVVKLEIKKNQVFASFYVSIQSYQPLKLNPLVSKSS